MTIDELRERIRTFEEQSRCRKTDEPNNAERMHFLDEWSKCQRHLEQLLTEKAQAEGLFPVGFLPVFLYPESKGENTQILKNVVRVKTGEENNRTLEFYANGFESKSLPSLPLKGTGEIWEVGWDIPTRWAVDASGQTWRDNAHGGAMHRCKTEDLLSEAQGDLEVLQTIHKLLGKKPPLPEWMGTALLSGWTPPSDFNRSDYE